MPVGAKTIPPAIPEAKKEPGKRCKAHGDQVPFPGPSKDPADQVEQRKKGVKTEKENIKEGVPHNGLHHTNITKKT
jgi:hypothetical protein